MAAQIRPHRLDVTDRFPMLSFTIRADGPPRVAEVVLATSPEQFTAGAKRSAESFYSSREHGLLTIPRGEAVYVVPPDVLTRFVRAERLYFALATATPPASDDWRVDVLPTTQSPYISLHSLTDRALRRVRMFPTRQGGSYGAVAPPPALEWAGDRGQPIAASGGQAGRATDATSPQGTVPAPGLHHGTGSAPSPVPYDDGFGPLPPLPPSEDRPAAPSTVAASPDAPASDAPSPDGPAPAAAAIPAMQQGYGSTWPRPSGSEPENGSAVDPKRLGFEADPESMGIEAPAWSPGAPELTLAAGLDLTASEYHRATRVAPSPAFTSGRAGTAVDRIVIHITDAPTATGTVSHFTRSSADSSAHYLIGEKGDVIQFVSEADTAWHAKGANRRSIGIEHVAVKQSGATYGGTTFPHQPPSEIEYAESAALVAHLCRKYGLSVDRATIVGHREADPNTTHLACPDGAWDWDHYMQLVAAASSSAQPAAESLGLPARARRRPTTAAMDAATITVSPELAPVTPPQVETLSQLRSLSLQATLAADPLLAPLVLIARAAAEAGGVSVGIGPQVSAGLLLGGGLGGGIIFAPGNVMGVYGQVELSAGFIASIGGSVQVTVVNGGVDAFSGVNYSAGVSGGEGITGGAAALFDGQRQFQGVTLQVGVGAGLSPVDIYTSVQHAVSRQLGYVEVEGGTARAATLGAAGDPVEIRYRVFIPSPLIKGPNSDYDLGPLASGEDFSGDNRGFSYDQGTSRGEITATLTLNADGGISGLTTVDRHWGESKAYDSSYTYHVDGKPDWWMDKHAGAEPLRRATLAAGDDNLSVSAGASSLTRNVLSVTSLSSVVTVKVEGSLPLVSPSPDIDADVSVYLRRGPDGGLQVMVVGDHDGFPAHELYVNRTLIYGYDPVAEGNGPSSLLPPTDYEISTGWVSVPPLATAGSHAFATGAGRGAARAMDADDWSLNWDEVFPIGQPTDQSCWATAAAMIDGWRRRQSVSVDAIARFDDLSTHNGLPPASAARFAEAIGLTVHPNACYTPEGFRDILEANGPVWVAAKVPGLHAIVVTGMYSKDGQYYVRITDPWDRVVGAPGAPGTYADTHATGSQYIMTYDAFAAEFEAAGDTDFAQLLHAGGTYGHVPNRGGADGAGYALSAGIALPSAPASADPSSAEGGAERLGAGTSLTRTTTDESGRRYELAQLAGFVEPLTALSNGAGLPLPGERVVLDDWPYIDGPSGRTQAGVAIDWQYRDGAVGEIAITPTAGQVLDGWRCRVQADIATTAPTSERVTVNVRLITTFSRAGEEDQVAVTEVALSGDGRQSTNHGVEPASPATRPVEDFAPPAGIHPQPVTV